MTVIGRQFLWPDAAGTPTDPDVAFATVGPGPTFEVHREREMLLILSCTGGAPRAMGLLIEVTQNGGTTWYPWAIRTMQSSAAATSVLGTRVTFPTDCEFRVSARRWGGTANSLLTVAAIAREDLPDLRYFGQPIDLGGQVEDGIECWGEDHDNHSFPDARRMFREARGQSSFAR